MTDKNVINFMRGDLQTGHLHLGAFAAINETMAVLNDQVLRGWKPANRWQRATGTEDGEAKGQKY